MDSSHNGTNAVKCSKLHQFKLLNKCFTENSSFSFHVSTKKWFFVCVFSSTIGGQKIFSTEKCYVNMVELAFVRKKNITKSIWNVNHFDKWPAETVKSI